MLYLMEAVDEYAVSALSEFEGRKSQDVAEEGISIDKGTETVKVS